jgi:hypothetical protein
LNILGDQYRLSLNEFGELTNVIKKSPQTPFEMLIGLRPNSITTRIISTDYSNFALYYYCNEQNPYVNHDELFVLIRNEAKMTLIGKELNRFDFDVNSFSLIEQDSKDCGRIFFNYSK